MRSRENRLIITHTREDGTELQKGKWGVPSSGLFLGIVETGICEIHTDVVSERRRPAHLDVNTISSAQQND
jgi:hypothetical protein